MKTTGKIRQHNWQEQIEARKNALKLFQGIRHRFETVDVINDVEYINDSKSTDIESAYYSLELIEKPVHWILLHSEFDSDYEVLQKLVKYKVISMIVIGKDDGKLKNTFSHLVENFGVTSSLEDGVFKASLAAGPGHAVLFSPAAAGFDLFSDYKEKGEKYIGAVNALKIN